jgi:multiple sugar transport system permease protein
MSNVTMSDAVLMSRRQVDVVRIVWMLVALVLALMTIFPLFWMISIAFKPAAEVFQPNLLPVNPSFDNFIYVMTEVPFLKYLGNTFFVSAVVTIVALFFHTMAGYALARLRFPGRETIFVLIFSTFLVSLPVIIVPLFILVRSMGMLNTYAGIIVPAIFHAFGIFLLRQYYLSLPRELEEAAIIDGASYWRIYWSVILPLSRPIIASLAILFFLANWNSFLWPLTVASDQDLWVVQVGIANFRSQYSTSWNYIMAASTIVATPMLVLFVIFQRQIMESIKTSGLKEPRLARRR